VVSLVGDTPVMRKSSDSLRMSMIRLKHIYNF
jgi:hypothetical protein